VNWHETEGLQNQSYEIFRNKKHIKIIVILIMLLHQQLIAPKAPSKQCLCSKSRLHFKM